MIPLKIKNDMNVLLVNARSLGPKLVSMVDTMHEIDTHVALVTETRMRDCPEVNLPGAYSISLPPKVVTNNLTNSGPI